VSPIVAQFNTSSMVSDGLLDKPEDTTYYDYLLEDAKDSPYASFLFHYRSWDNLTKLHLIPAGHPLLSPSDSITTLSSILSNSTVRPGDSRSPATEFSFGVQPLDDAVFEDKAVPDTPENRPTLTTYSLGNPPELLAPSEPSAIIQPSKASRDGSSGVQRPLPELPVPPPIPSLKRHDGMSFRSRQSSITSKASITPSLRHYLDEEAFLTDSVIVEDAVMFDIKSQQPLADAELNSRCSVDSMQLLLDNLSISDYETSILPSETSVSSFRPLPGNYLATTGSTRELQMSMYSPRSYQKSSPHRGTSPSLAKARQILGEEVELSGTVMASAPPEAEWMKGKASPVPAGSRGLKIKRMWSPQPRQRRIARPGAFESNKENVPSPQRPEAYNMTARETPDGNWF